MAPELVAPALVGGCALVAGLAVGAGERRRVLTRAGAVVGDVAPGGFAVRIRSRIEVRRQRGEGNTRLRQLVLGAAGAGLGLAAAGPAGAVAGLGVGAWVPRWQARRRAARRAALVEQQLADAMAGMSPSQAISFACEEGTPPLADDLRAVVRRESLGMPLDESLEILAADERSDDVRLAVSVLQLQHRVGGDAPAILDDAVRTLRQRVAAGAELRSLTAQARLSGTILGLLPIGFFLFMSVVSRDEVSGALASPIGLAAVVIGLLLDGGAFLWIRHLLRTES
jgi:Flp pilus assembly protein TadB